jgi:hypothetical protein
MPPQEVEAHPAYRLTSWLLDHGDELLPVGLVLCVVLFVVCTALVWAQAGARWIAVFWIWREFLRGLRRHRGARGDGEGQGHSPEYRAVMGSAGWRRRRGQVLHRQGGRCAVPGCTQRAVDVHHAEGYARLGRESLDELLGVCERHHRQLHGQ